MDDSITENLIADNPTNHVEDFNTI